MWWCVVLQANLCSGLMGSVSALLLYLTAATLLTHLRSHQHLHKLCDVSQPFLPPLQLQSNISPHVHYPLNIIILAALPIAVQTPCLPSPHVLPFSVAVVGVGG